MLKDDPCLDAKVVENPDSIHLPARFSNLNRPWINDDLPTKLYKSAGLQYQWVWAKSLPIRGLTPPTTIDDVMQWMYSQNCSFLAHGQSVWETVQRGKPVEIEGVSNCAMEDLYIKCRSRFGGPSCGLFPIKGKKKGFRLEIGDGTANSSIDRVRAEPLRLYAWEVAFDIRETLQYSVESLSIYDDLAGNVYLIDLFGKGFRDTCDRIISPTIEDTKTVIPKATVKSLLKFYKLRWLGFSGKSEIFQHRINHFLNEKSSKKQIQTFYCEELLLGVVNWAGPEMTTTCHLMYPQLKERRKIVKAREVMQHEMGSFWTTKFQPMVDEIEAIYVTKKVFTDVRNKLKRRMGEKPHDLHSSVVLKTPLVEDISEVHRRPILSKSGPPINLPNDFPTELQAVPDKNGGFRELNPENVLSEEVYYDKHYTEDYNEGSFYSEDFSSEEKSTKDELNACNRKSSILILMFLWQILF